jgi:hypothetical protein
LSGLDTAVEGDLIEAVIDGLSALNCLVEAVHHRVGLDFV